MDLSSIVDLDSAEFEVIHPKTGKGLGIFFTFLGPQHPIRKKGAEAVKTEVLKRLLPAANVEVDEESEDITQMEWLVNCTVGWRQVVKDDPAATGPFITFKGERLAFSQDAARRIYSDSQFAWLRQWADASMGKRDAFISDSSTISPAGSNGVTDSTGPSAATPA